MGASWAYRPDRRKTIVCRSLAAVPHDVQYRVDEGDVLIPHVPLLNRQEGVDFGAMFRRDLLHDYAPLDFYLIFDRYLSTDPSKVLASTGPSSQSGIYADCQSELIDTLKSIATRPKLQGDFGSNPQRERGIWGFGN